MWRPPRIRLGVEQRMQLRAFLRVDDPALDAPRRRPALPAMQFGQSGLGGGDLEAADLVEAPLPVDVQRQELLDRVGRERRSSSSTDSSGTPDPGACEEDPPVSGSGPWSTHRDAVPPAGGEFVGQVRADDAGPDDHNAR